MIDGGGGLLIEAGLQALLAIVFVLLSVFRVAERLLVEASRDPRAGLTADNGGSDEGRFTSSDRVRLAARGMRQATLLAAALILARRFVLIAAPLPYLSAFLLASIIYSLLLDQILARAVALYSPGRVLRLVRIPVAAAVSPLIPLAGLAEKIQELLHAAFRRRAAALSPGPNVGAEPSGRAEERRQLLETQGEMIENVMEFPGTIVREVMTPRTEMVTAERGGSLADLVSLVVRTNKSRIPVVRGGADHVVGMVHARDLLSLWTEPGGDRGFESVIRTIRVVPETMRAMRLLEEMQAEGAQMVIVVDEYGGTAGLITVEDLVEELVGEIGDEHEEQRSDVMGAEDGTLLVRASLPVADLEERLGVDLPEVEADSVGGLIVEILGRLPEAGDSIDVGDLCLEVVEADRRRVRRVRVRRPAEAAEAGEAETGSRGE